MNRGRIEDDFPIVLSILVATYWLSKFNEGHMLSAIQGNTRLFGWFMVSPTLGTMADVSPSVNLRFAEGLPFVGALQREIVSLSTAIHYANILG